MTQQFERFACTDLLTRDGHERSAAYADRVRTTLDLGGSPLGIGFVGELLRAEPADPLRALIGQCERALGAESDFVTGGVDRHDIPVGMWFRLDERRPAREFAAPLANIGNGNRPR